MLRTVDATKGKLADDAMQEAKRIWTLVIIIGALG
jgi:hypothetical protein